MSPWALSSGVPAAGPPNISPRNPFMTPSIVLRSGSSGGENDLGLERMARFGDRLGGFCFFSTALNTARTGSISAFQLDQQFGSFGFGSGLSHDFAPVHRLALAFGHACRTIR